MLAPVLALASACSQSTPKAEPSAFPTAASPSAVPTTPGPTAPSVVPTTPSPGGPSPLEAILLRPDDIGPGVAQREIPGGRGLSRPTLDLCDGTFRSEAMRTDRIQVVFTDRNDRTVVSNEVVAYRPGGAERAYEELRLLVGHCPTSYPIPGGSASQVSFGPRDPRLRDHQLVASVRFSRQGQSDVWSAAVYQFLDDRFTGVYTYGPAREDALRLALRLGVLAGERLSGPVVSA